MEENTLIPIQAKPFDEQIYGVKIERGKRRHKKKSRGKKSLILALLICAIIVTVNNFDSISSFLKSLFEHPGVTPTVSESININSESDSVTSESQDASENVDDSSNIYPFIDTSPDKFTTVYEFDNKLDLSKLTYAIAKKKELYDRFGEGAPIVLIVNFSPLECYSGGNGYSYSSNFTSDTHNVTEIAKEICGDLNASGINAVYLTFDSTEETLYEGQKQYEEKIKDFLKSNPSIAYVFDISRSLQINRDMSIYKETVDVNGESVPTINFVCSTKSGSLTQSQEKAAFYSNELSSFFNTSYPLLVSKQTFSRFELNQRFSVPCIRVDIGSYASTFDEAYKTAKLFSLLLSNFLDS